MNINWKIRIRNKAWLIAMAGAVIALAYQVAEVTGITPCIDQERLLDVITTALTLLSLLGIVVDPTTPGVEDSERAMTYGTELDVRFLEDAEASEAADDVEAPDA